jgi:arylsulfatase A-like enzyme
MNVKGLGKSFPHKVDGGKPEAGPDYYGVLPGTPFGHEYLLDFSKTCIREERLGRNPDNVPDLYAVSLSSHDYVNHAFGPESREAMDDLVRLDALLADFFKFLDDWVGLDRTAIVLTSDHGFSRSPEYWKDVVRIETARIDHDEMMKKLNAALALKFGEGMWAIGWELPYVTLDRDLIEQKKLSREDVEREAARMLSALPGVHTVFTATQLRTGALPDTRLARQAVKSWHPQVGGDLLVIPKDGWYLYDKPVKYASMHGTPWNYDTQVPLMFLGRRWFEPGKYAQEADPADIAPTLSHILGTGLPSGSEGRALAEILRR